MKQNQKPLRTTWIANGLDSLISIRWYCMAVVRLIRNYNTVTLIISGWIAWFMQESIETTHIYSFFFHSGIILYFVCLQVYLHDRQSAQVSHIHTNNSIPWPSTIQKNARRLLMLIQSNRKTTFSLALLPSVWMKSAQNLKLNMHKNRTK